jgi:sulfate permease, SulP family
MFAKLPAQINMGPGLAAAMRYLRQPLYRLRDYDLNNLRPDVAAGLSVAVVYLPQSIAFALIAELPPIMGIYTAIIGSIMAALWGSSNHMINGPTNAMSLLVAASLTNILAPNSLEFIIAAGMMAVMAGVLQLVLGLARLGLLINFVSHSVIVGFAGGAGILIAINQIEPLLGINLPNAPMIDNLWAIVVNLPDVHLWTAVLGLTTMVIVILVQKFYPKLPAILLGILAVSVVVFLLNLGQEGVAVIGEIPASLPPPAKLPLLDLNLIARLSTGALAMGAIGLVQTSAIARSLATQTGQHLDSNQEFVGQGMANIASGFFSGYGTGASFSVSAVNVKGGARTSVAAICAGLFILAGMFAIGSLTIYLPRAAMAGVLLVVAYGMVDWAEMGRILKGTRSDALIMLFTLLGTVFLSIEFAILAGILLSFSAYILKTSAPRVVAVLPDKNFKHLTQQPGRDPCPQLAILEIKGDLYFGAVTHVEEEILAYAENNPSQRFLLIRMSRVNHCDFSGIHMLENVVRTYRDKGGDVFLVRVADPIQRLMEATGCHQYIGEKNILSEDEAISHIFRHVLDPAICIYECPVRAFKECQNLPKQVDLIGIPASSVVPPESVVVISAQQLWQQLHDGPARQVVPGGLAAEWATKIAAIRFEGQEEKRPLIIDVREPREFHQGHIPEAELIPLPELLKDDVKLPNNRQIVFVCRSGRRSMRAAYAIQKLGGMNVAILEGGMHAWEAAGLLEAVEIYAEQDEGVTEG